MTGRSQSQSLVSVHEIRGFGENILEYIPPTQTSSYILGSQKGPFGSSCHCSIVRWQVELEDTVPLIGNPGEM